LAILLGCGACSLRVLALTPPQLSCKVRGFYPFPGGPRGPVAWLFRDTHQALSVVGEDKARLHMDFMTEGGQAHPVWWDEGVKWKVLLGQSIQGEVRIRSGGRGGLRLVEGVGGVTSGVDATSPSSKLERLRQIAEGYDCSMNLYSNNCRIFCARMRREAERLNAEDLEPEEARSRLMAADVRLAIALVRASALPMLYPAGVLLLCWEGLRDL
jgi:hypothetical protein